MEHVAVRIVLKVSARQLSLAKYLLVVLPAKHHIVNGLVLMEHVAVRIVEKASVPNHRFQLVAPTSVAPPVKHHIVLSTMLMEHAQVQNVQMNVHQ